jgi:hypothetical protein
MRPARQQQVADGLAAGGPARLARRQHPARKVAQRLTQMRQRTGFAAAVAPLQGDEHAGARQAVSFR